MKKKALTPICLSLIIIASVAHPSIQASACEHCEAMEYTYTMPSPTSPTGGQETNSWQETMNTEAAEQDEHYAYGTSPSYTSSITGDMSPNAYGADTAPSHPNGSNTDPVYEPNHEPSDRPDRELIEGPCPECETIRDSMDNLYIENGNTSPYGIGKSIVREYWSGPAIGYKKSHSRTVYCIQGHEAGQTTE